MRVASYRISRAIAENVSTHSPRPSMFSNREKRNSVNHKLSVHTINNGGTYLST